MKTSNPPFTAPSQNQIAQRAREIWLTRGSPEGQDVEIWFEAERQLVFSVKDPARPDRAPQKKTTPVADADINDDELQERLSKVGKPARPSPTSLSL